MATILFAWELGGGYGHLSRLLPVARELQRRGHDVVFAVRDLLSAEILLQPHGIATFQAPIWLGQITNLPEPISYAEMLMRFGYLNAQVLTGLARAWRHLVQTLQPGLIVLDHAPTALLGTRNLGLPRVNLGDGFCIPPSTHPMPPFRAWQKENLVRLRDSEQHVLGTSNAVLTALGDPPLNTLADLLACDEQLFCSFAELDHYPHHTAHRNPSQHIGPIFSLGQGAAVEWPDADGPKVFAYLKPEYRPLDSVLGELSKLQASVLVHVPGAARKTLQSFTTDRMAFSTAPLDMEEVRTSCDWALCHGGAGATAALLLAGKPLMLFPMHMEQVMTARRLESLGVATSVTPDAAGQLPRPMVKRVLANAALAKAAQVFALQHAHYQQEATVSVAVNRCEALLVSPF